MRKLILGVLALVLIGAGCATATKTVPFAEPFALKKGETVRVADTDLELTLKGFYFDDADCSEGVFCIRGPEWIVKYEVRKNGLLVEPKHTEYHIQGPLPSHPTFKSDYKTYATFQVEYRQDVGIYRSNKWHFGFNYPYHDRINEINDRLISLIPLRDSEESIKRGITSIEIKEKLGVEALTEIRNLQWAKVISEKEISHNNITATQLIIEDTSGVVESGVLLHYYLVPIKNATLIIKGWSDGVADSIAQSLQIYRK